MKMKMSAGQNWTTYSEHCNSFISNVSCAALRGAFGTFTQTRFETFECLECGFPNAILLR